jgi:hypothetical protein
MSRDNAWNRSLEAPAANGPTRCAEPGLWARGTGAEGLEAPSVRLPALSEAVTNVVLHAYWDGEPGRVRVEASMEAELLMLVVTDDGVGMSPNTQSAGLGMGLVLIERLAEHMEIHSAGGARLALLCACAAAKGGVYRRGTRYTYDAVAPRERSDSPEVRGDRGELAMRRSAHRRSAPFQREGLR